MLVTRSSSQLKCIQGRWRICTICFDRLQGDLGRLCWRFNSTDGSGDTPQVYSCLLSCCIIICRCEDAWQLPGCLSGFHGLWTQSRKSYASQCFAFLSLVLIVERICRPTGRSPSLALPLWPQRPAYKLPGSFTTVVSSRISARMSCLESSEMSIVFVASTVTEASPSREQMSFWKPNAVRLAQTML